MGYGILDSSYDIDRQKPDDELLKIRTNYEGIFREKGLPITYIKFKFNKNDYNGLLLIDQEIQENKYVNELLRCNYNEGFNFGTFRVAIDRFKNQMNSLNIAYEAVYLQTNKSPRSFIWINNFYSNEPSELIPSDWLSNEESQEIRQEFLDNANCIDAKMHDVFVLTNNYKK